MPGRTIIAIVLAAFMMSISTIAYGHASLISSDPASGAVVETAPAQIVLTFSEPASALAMQLLDGSGKPAAIGGDDISSTENRITVVLAPGLGGGTHALSWRAASSDGHPIAGTVFFSIGSASGNDSIDISTADVAVRGLLWLARATMLIALLLGAGSSGFRMVAETLPLQARRVTFLAVTLGVVAVVLSVPLHGLDALGRPLSDLCDPEVWTVAMGTGYGASVTTALVAMFLATIAVSARRPELAGWISILSLTAIGLTATLSGHASSADPRWLTRSMIFLHVVSIAWWAGELLPLAFVLRQGHAVADPPLMRFSRFIPFVIAPLVVSGVTLAAIQLGPPGPAWLSPYGYLFVGKLLLLSCLFGVAAWNRWYLTGRVVAGEEEATQHLRSAIAVEIVLIMVIVGIAAGWRFTPPPRSLAVELVSQRTVPLQFPPDSLSGRLSIAPARAGQNLVTVDLFKQDAPAMVRSVRVFFSRADLGIERLEIQVASSKPGSWQASDVFLPGDGLWTASVEVRVSDFEQVRGTAQLDLKLVR